MRFRFLSIFVGTVIIATIVGLGWAFLTADRAVVEDDGLKGVMASERNAIINSERNLRTY